MTRDELKAMIRERISDFAFIPLNELRDNYSLDAMRPDFGQLSKLAMLTSLQDDGIMMPLTTVRLSTLDTVDDFVDYIELVGRMGLEPVSLVIEQSEAEESVQFMTASAPMPHASSMIMGGYDDLAAILDEAGDGLEFGGRNHVGGPEDYDDDLASMLGKMDEISELKLKQRPESGELESPKSTGRILEL